MEGSNNNQDRKIETRASGNALDAHLVFGGNKHFAFIYKKTEKLVTAVYMITNFIKDNEPLKWKIRDNALDLMSLNLSFNTVSLSERKELLKEYQALSLEIVSLSSIAMHSGLISSMNFEILSREFSSLVSVIEKDENKRANEETVILDPGFFETEPKGISNTASTTSRPAENVLYKGHPAQAPAPSIDMTYTTRKPEYLPVKDISEKIAEKTAEKIQKAPRHEADSKDSRQNVIIKLLTKKSGLSIQDFTGSIKGVSVKTIQRELLAMVAAGVLKKEGERRWSTYSLAK